MTYEHLFYLKFKRKLSTCELIQRFPEDIEKVNRVALLDIPETTLSGIIGEKKDLDQLKKLKKRYSRFF